MEAAQEQAIDSLASLEERITRAVQVITALRTENGQLQQRLKSVQEELAAAAGARDQASTHAAHLQTERDELTQRLQRATGELDDLRSERKQVRSRIEKLLNQLDLLSAS